MYREIIYKYAIKNVNLREGKSLESKIITVIPKGSAMQIVDAEEDWYKVKYNDQEGYVYNENISKTLYPWASVNLRESPSSQGKPIEIVPRKRRVELIGIVNDWDQVIYDGQEGYIYSYYLSDDGNKQDNIDYTDFYKDMTKFVNEKRITSSSNYLLVTDLKNRLTYVFKRENDRWEQLYKWSCTIGKPSTPTITGTFFISGRKPGFGTNIYSVKYATRIRGPYYYHSILYNAEGTKIKDGRLGEALSHGCVRLSTQNAQWIYDNIPDGTTVFIH